MSGLVDDVRDALCDFSHEGPEYRARFRFSPDLPMFGGHFPSDPVLPGVHQIEMVRTTIEAARESSHRIVSVKSAKFRRPISPGEEIVVQVACAEVNGALIAKGTATVGDEVAAQITLTLHMNGASS